MAAVLVRDLSPEEHRALKIRAMKNGRSLSAEICAIVHDAVLPEERLRLGTAIHELAMKYGGIELEIERDQTPGGQVSFE